VSTNDTDSAKLGILIPGIIVLDKSQIRVVNGSRFWARTRKYKLEPGRSPNLI